MVVAYPVHMPLLSDSMEYGVIVKWYKSTGDYVNAGEMLLDVETDKAIISIEAPVSGTLLFAETTLGKEIAVNSLIAVFGKSEEKINLEAFKVDLPDSGSEEREKVEKSVIKTIGTNEKDDERKIEWILLPHLGETSSNGKLVKWLVKIGDALNVGTPIADVETDKAIIEIESYREGEVAVLNARPGEIIKYGDRLIGLKALKT